MALVLLAGMAVLVLAATWHQGVAADQYRAHPNNRRIALFQAGKERGLISTASGVVLAYSEPDPQSPRTYVRRYPAGDAFASVIGAPTLTGGLEEAYVDELRSRRDISVSDLMAALFGEDLRPRGLQITLDADLQQRIYEVLARRRGAVAAVDPFTGEVLALVSSPGSTPTDRAAGGRYPLGSVFKIITAAAALDTQTADGQSSFPDQASWQIPGGSHAIVNPGNAPCGDAPRVSLLTSFVLSCNLAFAELALDVGPEAMEDYAAAFGFGMELAFPLFTPVPLYGVEGSSDTALVASAGTGRLALSSPLHMAAVAAVVANGGEMVNPYLTAGWTDADGKIIESGDTVSRVRVISVETAAELARMMERVVTEGTGSEATVAGHRVAGKTGTGRDEEGRNHAWFVGFAPVESPTIALAVMIEPGGEFGESVTGATAASSVASELFSYWLQRSQPGA
jgi:peptidoglycan glycosyltransferase